MLQRDLNGKMSQEYDGIPVGNIDGEMQSLEDADMRGEQVSSVREVEEQETNRRENSVILAM